MFFLQPQQIVFYALILFSFSTSYAIYRLERWLLKSRKLSLIYSILLIKCTIAVFFLGYVIYETFLGYQASYILVTAMSVLLLSSAYLFDFTKNEIEKSEKSDVISEK